jgi:nitrite reductase (NO-forming)/hydroxylamine reductase
VRKFATLTIILLAVAFVAGCTQPQVATKEDIEKLEKHLEEISEKIVPAPKAEAVEAKPAISAEVMEKGKELYFDRCAGCHGTLRKGATGPKLTTDRTRELGTDLLKALIANGRPGTAMPPWKQFLTNGEIETLALYIQEEPPEPPFYTLEEIAASAWAKPKSELPTAPTHGHDVEDLLVVTLRDAGKQAIIDQETKEVVKIVGTGFATHVTKFSTDGRFAISMGRDGKVTKIDLYSLEVVGEVKIGIDARDVTVSRAPGYEDKYIIAGAYWPPQAVILDFETMKPLRIINLQGMDVDGEYQKEVRAAAMYASKQFPIFIVNAKESGMIWLVDYTDIDNLRVDIVKAEKFLHDGFFDHTGRYWMIAANMRNKMVIVDTQERKLEAIFETGKKPHPGPGARWKTKQYGWVAATVHIGEGKVSIWGIDPDKPEYRWKVIKDVKYPATSGGLFIRTHEGTPYVWFDSPLSSVAEEAQQIYVMDKETFELVKILRPTTAEGTLALHIEFNRDGSEAWVSVWDKKKGGKDNAIVVYDSNTLEEKFRFTNDKYPELVTPTGKFQAYLRSQE